MKATTLQKLDITPEQYESMIWNLYSNWCESVSTNNREYQKVLANAAVNRWFLMELAKCEKEFHLLTDRYVGSEPVCDVTHTYNQCLREQLPCYQIRFHEIPRKTYGDQIISASEVRKKYAENQLKSVCGMLPESTWRYLERKKNENGK